MKKTIFTLTFMLILASAIQAQVGIGAGGGGLNPGLMKSKLYQSQFVLGAGFDVFARHTLFKLDQDYFIDARYSYRSYFSDIDLPLAGKTRFIFSYLAIDVSMDIFKYDKFEIYGGVGMSLLTGNARQHYSNDISESAIIPELISGVEYNIGEYFNLFGEILFQFGSLEIKTDVVPVTGVRFMVGGTMFLKNSHK